MKHQYAASRLAAVIAGIDDYTADEFRRMVIRIINGATGTSINDDCHLLTDENEALRQTLNAAMLEIEKLRGQMATVEADVLDREAKLIISAPHDDAVNWSKDVIDVYHRIGTTMQSRAALARAKVGT